MQVIITESILNNKFIIPMNVNRAFLEKVIGEDLATLFQVNACVPAMML